MGIFKKAALSPSALVLTTAAVILILVVAAIIIMKQISGLKNIISLG